MKHKFLCALVIIEALVIPADASFVDFAESTSRIIPHVTAAETLPSKFDLRDENRIPPIRNQNPWGTCWTFAAVAAMESSYLTNFNAKPEDVDFSEMYLVWFSRINQDKSRSFSMYDKGRARLIHMGDYGIALQDGAYPTAALACMARLDGPADESEFPYLSSARFAEFGFTTSNPPTHEEAEQAGLIPLRTSTPELVDFADGRLINTRQDLILTDALFAAPRTTPSSFANQREDYAYNNRVDNTALKTLIKNYGAAMIGYYSNEKAGTNLNAATSAYYDSSSWIANHEITIIGWDDDYHKENFLTQPSSNGAWLARNNWGEFSGSDGGYEWISYEQLIGDGSVCIIKERPENLRVYEYDPLGWCNSYTYREKSIWGANVFQAKTSGEKLHSVSFYTPYANMQADIFIYNIGASFDGKNPRAGTLIASKTEIMPYAGYHTVELENSEIVKGNYFSAVIKYTNLNEGDSETAGVPVEVAVKGYSNNAAVYDRESYISDTGEPDSWDDGTEMVDDFHGGIPYHVNACIKVFTTAPNDDEITDSQAKTIMGFAINEIKPDSLTIKTPGSIPSSRAVITPAGVAANSAVSVYLAQKTRYEPVANITESMIDTQHAKGLSGPTEWAVLPVYPAGYKPDTFFQEDGINYATYGPFVMNTDENGKITVDVNALKYSDGRSGKIAQGYYTVYCVPEGGVTSETGVFLLSATSDSSGNTDSENSGNSGNSGNTDSNSGNSGNYGNTDSNTNANTGSSGGGGGGGCNAGFFGAGTLILAFIPRRKH